MSDPALYPGASGVLPLRIVADTEPHNEEEARLNVVLPYLLSLGYKKRELRLEHPPGAVTRERTDVLHLLQGEVPFGSAAICLFVAEIKFVAERRVTDGMLAQYKLQLARYVRALGEQGRAPSEAYLFVVGTSPETHALIYSFTPDLSPIPVPHKCIELLTAISPEKLDIASKIELVNERIADIRSRRLSPLAEDRENLAILFREKYSLYSNLRQAELTQYLQQLESAFPGMLFPRTNLGLPELLGEGAESFVVRAYHRRLQVPVAVKWLRPSSRLDGKIRQRARRAFETLQRIRLALADKPVLRNIVNPLGDFVENEFGAGYVMEYREGDEPLTSAIRQLRPVDVLQIIARLLDALAACFALGILHRDLHPANILIREDSETRDLQPIVVDFDMLDIQETQADYLSAFDKSRLPHSLFSAPEIFEGRAATIASEVYSMGRLLWFSLSGYRVFDRSLADRWFRREGYLLLGDTAPLIRKLVESMCGPDPGSRADLQWARKQIQHCLSRVAAAASFVDDEQRDLAPTLYEDIYGKLQGKFAQIYPYSNDTCNLFAYLAASTINAGDPFFLACSESLGREVISLIRRDMSNDLAVLDFTSDGWLTSVNILTGTDTMLDRHAQRFQALLGQYFHLTGLEMRLLFTALEVFLRATGRALTLLELVENLAGLPEESEIWQEIENGLNEPRVAVRKVALQIFGKAQAWFSDLRSLATVSATKPKFQIDWLVRNRRPMLVLLKAPVRGTAEALLLSWFLYRYHSECMRQRTSARILLASEIEIDIDDLAADTDQAIVLGRAPRKVGGCINLKVTHDTFEIFDDQSAETLPVSSSPVPVLAGAVFVQTAKVIDQNHDKFSYSAETMLSKISRFQHRFASMPSLSSSAGISRSVIKGSHVDLLPGKKALKKRFFGTSTRGDLQFLVRTLAKQPLFDEWESCMLALGKLAVQHADFKLNAKISDVVLSRIDSHPAAQHKINHVLTLHRSGKISSLEEAKSLSQRFAALLVHGADSGLPRNDKWQTLLRWYLQRLYYIESKESPGDCAETIRLAQATLDLLPAEPLEDSTILRWCAAILTAFAGNQLDEAALVDLSRRRESGWSLIGAGDARKDMRLIESARTLFQLATSFMDTRAHARVSILEVDFFFLGAGRGETSGAFCREIEGLRFRPGFETQRGRLDYLLTKILGPELLTEGFTDELVQRIETAIIVAMRGGTDSFEAAHLFMYLSEAVPGLAGKPRDARHLLEILVALNPRFHLLSGMYERESETFTFRSRAGTLGADEEGEAGSE